LRGGPFFQDRLLPLGTDGFHRISQDADPLDTHFNNIPYPRRSDVLDACNSVGVAIAIEESAVTGKPVAVKRE
jgi:hypothetical protein